MTEFERQEFDPEVEAKQRRGALRTALVLALIVLAIGAAAFWYLWNMRLTGLGSVESVNVLVLGVSDDDVEAVFVATFHPETDSVSALAVPVDTRLPWLEETVHLRDTYDGRGHGAIHSTVERLVSAPIHHTVRVDFSGFVELVDLVQGVPVEVESDIVYRDADGEVVFALTPDVHRLSGEEALLYVRYKGDHLEDESRRLERQRRFVEALIREARANLGWSTVQDMLQIALNRVTTDLDIVTMTRLAKFVFDAGDDAFTLHVLPGKPTGDGWDVDRDKLGALSAQLFHNPSWEAAGR